MCPRSGTPIPELTLTVLGCGTMDVVILSGILDSLTNLRSRFTTPSHLPSPGTFTPLPIHGGLHPPPLGLYGVKVIKNDNIRGVSEGDIVLLGYKPQMCEEILEQEGMREVLEGKLLVSILAGVRLQRLREFVPETSETALITWIFNQIGLSLVLPEKHMDTCTALYGAGPTFYAFIIEAMSDGGGTGRMVLRGEHPAIIREQVSTPAGYTIGELLVLEDGKVRSMVARGIQDRRLIDKKSNQGNPFIVPLV
ncbi:hypothetical protein EV426DRAFT_662572 [Tirmania nivea]|nr:hypothetical protein EV426DRAFT_662572 [Tirmania nivea]